MWSSLSTEQHQRIKTILLQHLNGSPIAHVDVLSIWARQCSDDRPVVCLALSHLPISEYLPRKEFIRKLILSWIEIINFERHKSGWAELKHRGIINEKDYKNSVFT